MNTKECNIVKNLLESYGSGMLSAESIDFIENHCESCPECKAAYQKAKEEKDLRSRDFDNLAKKVGKSRRKANRKLIIAALIVVLLGANTFAGVKLGFPLITLASSTIGDPQDSVVRKITSVGFNVYQYSNDFANYTTAKPWFVEDEGPVTLTDTQYTSLMSQLTAKMDNGDADETAPESKYLEVKGFSQCHIYKVTRDTSQDKTIFKVYCWYGGGTFTAFKKQVYNLSGGSFPIIITAESTSDTSDSITLTDVWLPDEGSEYEKSIKDNFPADAVKAVFAVDNGSKDAWNKLEQEASLYFNAPIGANLLNLDVNTGEVQVVRCYDNYDENGEYKFETEIIYTGVLDER